jgi:hypothetical protein
MHRLRSRPVLIGAALAALAIIVVASAMLVGGFGPPPTPSPLHNATPSPTQSPSPSPTPTPAGVCPLTGEPVMVAELAEREALLVQIENHPAARPAAGLSLADLVIEAPVEGDTTRFAAVYLCQPDVGAVGPVRSARYFNVDLWQQLRALTMHFGAGFKVLSAFAGANMPSVNGLDGGWPQFARSSDRPAPHNVYLDLNAVRAAIAEGGALADLAERSGETRAPFVFDAEARPPAGRSVGSVAIQTNEFWRFGWTYDVTSQRWERSDAGQPIIDPLTDEPVSARSIMVQIVSEETLVGELDAGGYPRRRQFLVGSGDGVLYVDGTTHPVRWERPTAGDVTTWFYADSGEPVILPPGQVWWEIVPIGTGISESP